MAPARAAAAAVALLLVLVWSAGVGTAQAAKQEEARFIGWEGEVPHQHEQQDSDSRGATWFQLISWRPRAYILRNFISASEALHIAREAWPHMQRSTVVAANGSSVEDSYRTSFGTFLNRYHDDVVARVQRRVSEQVVRVPVVHQEDMQVLRYGVGQYYHAHQDSLDNDSPRMATLLIYLADVEDGGETSFPDASQWAHPSMAATLGADLSQCAKGHVAFKPRRGDALLFWSVHPDGKTDDPASTHEGCPVIKGSKWTTTIWTHTKPFRPEQYDARTDTFNLPKDRFRPGLCVDAAGERRCRGWKRDGECGKNPGFMNSQCTAACGLCEPCNSEQDACFMRNRRKLGYLVFNESEILLNL